MDFFLCYHHDDSKLAGRIKQELEKRDSTAFLAHEDIEISKTWREEILTHLRLCQALITVVTPSFAQSAYANQEVGYILGKGKPVISLNFAKDLPGFLESIQAIHASESTIGSAVGRAIKVIEGKEPEAYIEPAFKTSQEIEAIATDEIGRHLRLKGEKVQVEPIDIQLVKLNDDKGIFDMNGRIKSYDRYRTYYWAWTLSLDARSGRVLSKQVLKTPNPDLPRFT